MGEHYFIISALTKDFYAVESRGATIESSLASLIKPYSYLSGDNNVKLALYKGQQSVYSNGQEIELESRFLEPPEDGTRLSAIEKSGGHTYVIVSGKLPQPYNAYTLVYIYDTTDAIQTWQHMKNMLFVIGLIISGLLAVGLLLLLNRIFKPLSQISYTSRKIAEGDYETRLTVSGRDELSEMARSFNHMAEEIQRQMTELITAAEKKQQFIDNFAHELRTPLTAIYGYAEYLQKVAITEDDRLDAIQYIMSGSQRMQNMAAQLLELANLSHDEIFQGAQSVSGLFQSVERTLSSRITEKEIHIEYRLETDLILGDAFLLESLFINLIDNAIKACGIGGQIIVHASSEAGNLKISIQDNGKGMTPEVLQHITEPFYRAEKSRNRKDGGAGLGLSICQQIVLRHGAELTFMSRPDEGTTAIVFFYNFNMT
ncbi:sensor histidine kinase [Paenibacillus glycanilyticus]|uniref:sensor histidine kinase n=1 Tax=Paenibacillus glycanilyticus TaxID=126569 RepID=UPI001FD100F6|nr:HAMP domain-containing sensor histidine kinase [Paenibacillus glycanilyticus]